MAYKLLNNIFYPDVSNIIIEYLLPNKKDVRRGFKINKAYMDGIFAMMIPDGKQTILIQHLNMVKRVNKMLLRLDNFKCKKIENSDISKYNEIVIKSLSGTKYT